MDAFELGVSGALVAECHIDQPVQHHLAQLVLGPLGEFDLHRGMPAGEALHQGRQEGRGQRCVAAEPQRAVDVRIASQSLPSFHPTRLPYKLHTCNAESPFTERDRLPALDCA